MPLPTNPASVLNTLFSTTTEFYAEEMTRNIVSSSPLIDYLYQTDRVRTGTGGTRIDVGVDFGFNPGSQWYDGADVLDMTPFEVTTTAKYDWKNLHAPVTYTGTEKRKNSGVNQRRDLVKLKIRATEDTLYRIIEMAMVGDGTANAGKSILGLEAMFTATPTVDPAVGAIGGITAVGNPYWQNAALASFGSFAANGPGGTAADAFLDFWMDLSDGSDAPDLILSSPDVYQAYNRAIVDQTQVILSQNATGNLTFRYLAYNTARWIWSNYIPSGTAYMLRTRDLLFYVHRDANMTLSEWVKPFNQDMYGASMLMMCAFIPVRRFLTGIITGVTA